MSVSHHVATALTQAVVGENKLDQTSLLYRPVFMVSTEGVPDMIYYGCPACDAPMSSPESLAGQRERCPDCGNVAVVPQNELSLPTTSSSPPNPARSSGSKRLTFSPVMFRNSPILYLVLVGSMFLCLVLARASWNAPDPRVSFWCFATAGGCALVLIIWWLACISTRLIIEADRVIQHHGILSRSTSEVRARDIRNVQVSQGVFQRMMGTGSVAVSTAAQSDMEIKVHGLRSPARIADEIRRRMCE